jgi:restriction system protein
MEILILTGVALLLGFLLIFLMRERPPAEVAETYRPTPLLQTLERIPQDEFEALIVELVERVGLRFEGFVEGRSEIVELLARTEGPIVGARYLIQAVRPVAEDHALDSLMVQYLYEVAREQGVQKAVLITTGVFTERARAWAEEKGLELIDGAQLSALLEQYRLHPPDIVPLPG